MGLGILFLPQLLPCKSIVIRTSKNKLHCKITRVIFTRLCYKYDKLYIDIIMPKIDLLFKCKAILCLKGKIMSEIKYPLMK